MDNPNFESDAISNGPDELAPADDFKTWLGEAGVKLRIGKDGMSSIKPVSIVTAFRETVAKHSNEVALRRKQEDKWQSFNYGQYYDMVITAAKAFIKLGLEKHMSVGILGFNTIEWFVSDLAAIFAGGFACGIYATNSAEACLYIANSAKCNILVVENDAQLQKILKIKKSLTHLKAIVQYTGTLTKPQDNLYTWNDLMNLDTTDLDKELDLRIQSIAPNKCSTLIYTSGTTGDPKGVMLSHDNLIWTSKSLLNYINDGREGVKDVIVSYLPLSHVAAQLLDLYLPLVSGSTVCFAQPDALKGSLATTLKEVRPTVFFGVPRVWEKMREAMVEIGKKNNIFKKTIINWAKDVGFVANIDVMNGRVRPACFPLANRLVFSKVKLQLGLDRTRIYVSGAAPNTRETVKFFYGLDIPVMDAYGLSETSAPHCVGKPNMFWIFSVGKEIPGVETLLHDPANDGEGEVCMRGRHVFMGYLNDETKTKEAIDVDGWFHSGDLGKKDKNNFLTITGRIKELIITAGGENVAPIPIEEKVKECLPCVSNCMLIGDKKKFLSMLIALKTVVDIDTMEPKDNLTPGCIEWMRSKGSTSTLVSEIIKNKDVAVMKAIQTGIDEANKSAPSRAQYIQKWTIVPKDFSVPGGELGPTLKLKRPVVVKMYAQTIDAFYQDAS